MLKVREIKCKTILNKSSLSDFTLNCYVGCSHRCLYCYARYMKKFKDRPEDWGDFDLLAADKTPSLGMTITTVNSHLQKALEPYASEPPDRINTLKKAQEKGIKTWVFLGPLIPEFTDTKANLEAIFRALRGLNLDQICVDRLNPSWGVLDSLKRGLSREDYTNLRLLLYKSTNPSRYAEYSRQLKEKTLECACQFNLSDKLTFCF